MTWLQLGFAVTLDTCLDILMSNNGTNINVNRSTLIRTKTSRKKRTFEMNFFPSFNHNRI